MAEDLEDDVDDGGSQGSGGPLGGAPSRRRGGGKKLLMLGALAALLIVGAAAGLYFSGILGSGEPKDPGAEQGASAADGAQGAGALPQAVFYDLPEMLVNLNSAGRRQSFLKIRVSLELQNALDVSRVEQVMPKVVDNMQVYLRELRVEDLQGAAGMLRLKEELLSRVNAAIAPARVNDVLFKEMLVQVQ